MVKNKCLILFFLIALISGLSLSALAGSTARNTGLGDDFIGITGADAIYSNPAAVNASDYRFTLEFGFNSDFWNNLLINDYIDESEKDPLLSKIKDSGWATGNNHRIGGKLIIGPLALFTDLKGDGLVRFSPDVAELILKGNEIGREYSLEGSEGMGGLYADTGVNLSIKTPEKISSALQVEKLYLGMTYHYLSGSIFAVEGAGNTFLGFDENDEPLFAGDGEFLIKYNDPEDNMATGTALDFGIIADMNDKISLGFSVMNIGEMRVDGGKYSRYTYELNENGEEVITETEKGELSSSLGWKLPLAVRLGGKMKLNEELTCFADYSHTRYDMGLNDNKFALGLEAKWLKFLPLRTGLNYSTLQNDFDISAGMGLYLGPVKTDIGISDLLGFFNRSKGVTAGINARIEF